MICKKCGNQLRENEKFCTQCGYYNDEEDYEREDSNSEEKMELEMEDGFFEEIDEFSTKTKSKEKKQKKEKPKKEKKPKKPKKEVIVEEYSTSDNPNVVAYIGEDYKWIAEKPFNIYALLFSWIYFLYRKQYLIGILGLVLTGFMLRLFPKVMPIYIIIVMMGCGLFFNKIYLDIVERKVAKIEKNAGDLENVEETCRKKGGVNVWIPLLIFLIFLAVMVLTYINFPTTKQSKYWSENSMNQANCKSMGRYLYESIGDDIKEGTLKEVGCEIKGTSPKLYHFYYVIEHNGLKRYLYYENNESGEYHLRGDTSLIQQYLSIQNQYGLSIADEQFLTNSQELAKKFDSIRSDSAHEDKLINTNKDFKEKTHFIFTKDDIYH